MPVAAPMTSYVQIAQYEGTRPAANTLAVSDRMLIKADERLLLLLATACRKQIALPQLPTSKSVVSSRFVLSDDEPVPMRVVEPSGEYFSGRRGKLLVIKKQQ